MHLGTRLRLDVRRRTFWSSNRHQTEERGFKWLTWKWLLVPDGWSECFHKLLIYWDFHTQPSLVFTENGLKKRKYPGNGSCVAENVLFDVRGQRRMDKLVGDDKKTTLTQITTRYDQDLQNTISEHTHIEPWSRWTPAAEDTRVPLLSDKKTAHGGYNSLRSPKRTIEDWKNLTSLDFCAATFRCRVRM